MRLRPLALQGMVYVILVPLERPDTYGVIYETESSIACRYGSGAPSPAGFGAFDLLEGSGLTQIRG